MRPAFSGKEMCALTLVTLARTGYTVDTEPDTLTVTCTLLAGMLCMFAAAVGLLMGSSGHRKAD